ncbi:MAG: transporter substrate-binding domain-containing protein [Desulfuromonas sp.]|nr:transporter substrate-binding domain-containing protein [Desulfuromonas sp.]
MNSLRFIILLGLTFQLALLAPLSAQTPSPSSVNEVVIVGGDHNYPPYEFLDDNGQPTGFIVELTRAIAEVMGFKVEIRLGDWGDMRHALKCGDVDILQGVAYLEERLNELDFTPPHSTIYQSIWTRTGAPIKTLDDLHGKEVIVMRDSVMHDFMRTQLPDVQLVTTNTLADALQLLASGHHHCALVSKLPGEYLKRKMKLTNIQPVARAFAEQPYGYAVRKGNRALLDRFSNGLAVLKESGRYQKIYHKWLGVLKGGRVPWQRVLEYGAMIVLPLLLILAATVLWSRTLKRKVDERTAQLSQEVKERKRAVEELQLRQKQLLQADKMTSLGILVSGVAHEINNPNGLITLNLPLLSRAWQDTQPILEQHYQQHGDFKLGWLNYSRMRDEIPQLLAEMQQCSKSIKSIVEDLKDFARCDDSPVTESVDLNTVVEAAGRLLDNQIRKSTRHFHLDLAAGLPSVYGRAQRLEQVVINLLLNACQALEHSEQGIRLSTRYHAGRGEVVVEVCDEGCGLDPEQLAYMMDPFFTTKREQGGTGLGLSVSAGIVKNHHGRLEFDSALGQGMRATLYLPEESVDHD